jgi:hypothetical protein
MSKLIKIRFIERSGGFYIQTKTMFGWEYIQMTFEIQGQIQKNNYFNKDKKILLEDVVKQHYGLSLDAVLIKEYPTIKYYTL